MGNGRTLTQPQFGQVSDVDIDQAFMAMASFPNLEEASAYLIEEHNIMATPKALAHFAKIMPERYERARAQAAPLREQMLAGNLLDSADMALKVQMLAIEQTKTLLEEGKVYNPAEVAAKLGDVVSKAIDKKLALEGRPSRVTVTRSVTEIFNQLEAMKVIEGNAIQDDGDLQ